MSRSSTGWLSALVLVLLLGAWLGFAPRRGRAPGEAVDGGAAEATAPGAALPPLLQPGPMAKLPPPAPERSPSRPELPPAPTGDESAIVVVRGRVLSESGAGLSGVDVALRAWSGSGLDISWSSRAAVPGPDGAFEVTIPASAGSAGLGWMASGEGFVETWRAITREEVASGAAVDVTLAPARAVSGRIVDADARPIAGATVLLWYGSDSTWPTTSDAVGRFLTPVRGPRRPFELVVWAPGYSRRAVPVAAADVERTDVGELVFRRGGSVAGVVVDPHGEPVQELNLVVDQVPVGKLEFPRARTDSRGRFEFTDLGLGTVSIYADAPGNLGGPPGSRRPYRGGDGGIEVGRRDVRLVVEAECTIELRFVDAESGEPVDVRRAEYGAREEGAPIPETLGLGGASHPFLTTRLTVASQRRTRYDVTVRSPGFEDGHVRGIDVRDRVEMTVDVRMRRRR